MENTINIAELLKDCPKGMELDCTIFEKPVKYTGLTKVEPYIITIKTPCGRDFFLTKEGYLYDMADSKCIIFPKGKTTWEGFVPPCVFKDGDVVAYNPEVGKTTIYIYRLHKVMNTSYYVALSAFQERLLIETNRNAALNGYNDTARLATEEEKAKLFQAIKDNGYKWNAETKTLGRLIEPKFKVGDTIQDVDGYKVGITEVDIDEECYEYISTKARGIGSIPFGYQDQWELVPDKFDISTLIPFESRVLVRDTAREIWKPDFFGCLCSNDDCPYMVVGGIRWKCCIPFEGNEHLLGKTDNCIDFYKTWE